MPTSQPRTRTLNIAEARDGVSGRGADKRSRHFVSAVPSVRVLHCRYGQFGSFERRSDPREWPVCISCCSIRRETSIIRESGSWKGSPSRACSSKSSNTDDNGGAVFRASASASRIRAHSGQKSRIKSSAIKCSHTKARVSVLAQSAHSKQETHRDTSQQDSPQGHKLELLLG